MVLPAAGALGVERESFWTPCQFLHSHTMLEYFHQRNLLENFSLGFAAPCVVSWRSTLCTQLNPEHTLIWVVVRSGLWETMMSHNGSHSWLLTFSRNGFLLCLSVLDTISASVVSSTDPWGKSVTFNSRVSWYPLDSKSTHKNHDCRFKRKFGVHGHLNDVLFLLTHHAWLLSAEEIPLKFSLGFKAAWIVPWGWTCCTHLNPDVIHFVYNVHKRIFYCKNTPSFCDNSCAGRNIQLNRILARTEHDETLFYRLWYKTVSAHGSSQCLIPNRNVGLLKVQMYSIRQFLFRIWYWRWCIIYITDVVFLLYWRDFGTISMLSS